MLKKKMGKNKKIHKNKDVFKVRSIKLKAKKMVTNLKKVSDGYLQFLN